LFEYLQLTGTAMTQRTVTDEEGRVWTCTPEVDENRLTPVKGQDVVVLCRTPGLAETIRLTVGWGWQKMAPKGLARLIMSAATR
jgi:hypothetical protein